MCAYNYFADCTAYYSNFKHNTDVGEEAMALLLQHRVKKLLSSSSELTQAKSLLDSLSELLPNDITSTSSAELRVLLKPSLDVASLDAAEAVLRETERLLSSMDALKKQADIMDRKCRHIMAFLDSTDRTSTLFVTQAAELRCDFLQKYQVSLDDLKLVEQAAPLAETHATDTAMASYFQLLHRLQAIRLNCERLVADNPAPSSLEYLEDICRAQTLAFEKLYAWASVLCNADAADPSDDDLVSVGAMVDTSNSDRSTTRLLPQALRFLRGHAAFYSYCVDAWTQSRRNGLLRRFVKALTIGGPSGIPRPIEIHAHDPVRYSGEMLAWVHQTLVGEAEFVKVSRAHHVAETHFSSQWQSQLDQYQAALKDSLDFSLSAAHPTLEIAHKVVSLSHGLYISTVANHVAAMSPQGHLIDTYVNSLRPHGIEATELAKVLDPVVQAVLIPLTSGGALPPSEMNVFVLNQLACLHVSQKSCTGGLLNST
ncbi:hypothetical protein DYB32_005559 [Aphanomyces invadans]|uniref:Conserved Oligomeric Golgi complex subunit 6 C-terminal domain-containing protein n=1 Tax=Aphanomyces invadans TaxID=157072 RepID=A0A3R6ZPE0_9STRA|nr:hypothetical protein DYB32_005559 [Aphanomyces invadans]